MQLLTKFKYNRFIWKPGMKIKSNSMGIGIYDINALVQNTIKILR